MTQENKEKKMKREFKFRAKCAENGQWVYGSLLQDDYGTFQLVDFIDHHETWHDIDPDTIGQFTGLFDKNKEIYEHDLVECAGVLCEIVYSDKIGSFVLLEVLSQDLGNKPIGQMIDMFGIRYVGNIYDNPELLKK